MGLFEAIGELCTMPIRCASEVVKDITGNGDNEEADAALSIMTLGTSSIVKGIGKTIQKSANNLD